MRKKVIVISGLAAAILAVSALGYKRFAHSKHVISQSKVEAAPVVVAHVKQQSIPVVVQAVGTLVANKSVNISSEVQGQVRAVLFHEGQYVQKGAPLVQLDDAMAKANLASTKAQLVIDKKTFQDMQRLVKSKVWSKQKLVLVQAALEATQAKVQAQEILLQKTTLRAPFSGYLGARDVNEGQTTSPGQTLVNLVDEKTLLIDYRVPEKCLPSIKIGQTVDVTVEAYKGAVFKGVVTFMAPTIDTATHTVEIRASLNNQKGLINPGMFAHVKQIVAEHRHALVLPEAAIISKMAGSVVYRIKDKKAFETPVVVGSRFDGSVEITKGLSPKDTIVIAGQDSLKDGEAVRFVRS